MREEMRKFSQLLPADEMKELVASLSSIAFFFMTGIVYACLAEQELVKERIDELQRMRKNGVTTLQGDCISQDCLAMWR